MEEDDFCKEDFKWPPELTKQFLHIRLQHEWLFQKRKQSWSTMHEIMMKHNFPKFISVNNMRKKWSNLFEDYKRSLQTKNYKWAYFELFHSYLGKSNSMEAYPNWTNEWLEKFIEIRSQNDAFFDGDKRNEFNGWNIVEYRLREIGLPMECSVRKIDEMWTVLLKTFKMRCRKTADGKLKYPWSLYEPMKRYFESNNIPYKHMKKERGTKKSNQDSDSESDNERLIDVKRNLIKSAEKKTNTEDDEDDDDDNDIKPFHNETVGNEGSDFRWSQEWTESFIHIRLQHDHLFKQKKQSWKRLYQIMMENGFPDTLSVDCIRKKWNSTFDEYQKAVTLNNKKWLYYDIFHGYIGDASFLDMFKNWPDDWIRKLIEIKTKYTLMYKNKKVLEEKLWDTIEKDLRKMKIPSECSVRNIQEIWVSLTKTFKVKHKVAIKKSATISWPFYNDMKEYYEKCEPKVLKRKPLQTQNSDDPNNDIKDDLDNNDTSDIHDTNDNIESDNDMDNTMLLGDIKDDSNVCEDKDVAGRDDSVVKKELLFLTCRACMGMSEVMLPLFKTDGVCLSEKLMALTTVQIAQDDNYPQNICQSCADELNSAYTFKKKCEETEVLLKSSWYKTEGVKKIKEEIPMIDPMDDYDDNRDDIIADESFILDQVNSDNEFIDSKIMAKPYEIVIKKRKVNKPKIKPKKKKIQRIRAKSKNIVLIPVVGESGKTVMKKKYVYWKVCDICGKATQRMTEHMRGHSDEKTLKCPKCPKMFRYSAGLQTHIKTHSETPLKICQLCGKEFYRNLTYRRHLVYHANERKFECESCGKCFNTSDILKVHMRSHTGERPFTCKICGKAFLSSGCVSRHQKVHRKLGQTQPQVQAPSIKNIPSALE